MPNVAADLDGFIVRAWPTESKPTLVLALCSESECGEVVMTWQGDINMGDLARAALGHECSVSRT